MQSRGTRIGRGDNDAMLWLLRNLETCLENHSRIPEPTGMACSGRVFVACSLTVVDYLYACSAFAVCCLVGSRWSFLLSIGTVSLDPHQAQTNTRTDAMALALARSPTQRQQQQSSRECVSYHHHQDSIAILLQCRLITATSSSSSSSSGSDGGTPGCH